MYGIQHIPREAPPWLVEPTFRLAAAGMSRERLPGWLDGRPALSHGERPGGGPFRAPAWVAYGPEVAFVVVAAYLVPRR